MFRGMPDFTHPLHKYATDPKFLKHCVLMVAPSAEFEITESLFATNSVSYTFSGASLEFDHIRKVLEQLLNHGHS